MAHHAVTSVHPTITLYKQNQRGKLTYTYHFDDDKEANLVSIHPGTKTVECVRNAQTLAVCWCNAGVGAKGIKCPRTGSAKCTKCNPGYMLAR